MSEKDDPNAKPSPPVKSPSGTVDVTNVVEAMRQSFVTWGTAYVFGLEVAIPGMEWVALPIISTLDQAAIREILDLVSRGLVSQAFFFNTALRKASQAADYIDAVEAKNSLPTTATPEEYENAEKVEMAAFRAFVVLGN